MNEMIAYCGVDCANCPDYLNKVCPSCRRTEWTEEPCLPVKCCREKEIINCGYCDRFPCDAMEAFYEESDSHRQAYCRMCKLKNDGGSACYVKR